jgi:hypothetical protein
MQTPLVSRRLHSYDTGIESAVKEIL